MRRQVKPHHVQRALTATGPRVQLLEVLERSLIRTARSLAFVEEPLDHDALAAMARDLLEAVAAAHREISGPEVEADYELVRRQELLAKEKDRRAEGAGPGVADR